MTARDLWQARYQILIMILRKEFTQLNLKFVIVFLEYEIVNENLIKHKCLFFNKNYSSEIDENLKKQFKNTIRFSDNDINTFILLLIKVYILMNICMIDKSLMIHHCQKNK